MNDEAYVFYEDVKEKSIIARGAHKRPNRQKPRVRKYTLKELEAMNGQVNSINLNATITYEQFKTLPKSLKKEYIQNLVTEYDAGPAEIARLLGMGVKNCSVQLRNLGFNFGRGHKQSKENIERMRADYGVVAIETKKMTLQNASFIFSGAFDANEFAKRLSEVIPNDCMTEISVEIKIIDEHKG